MSRSRFPKIIGGLLCGLLLSCDSNESGTANIGDAPDPAQIPGFELGDEDSRFVASLVDAYFQQVDTDFSAAGLAIEELAAEVERLLQAPNEANLGRVREAWLEANTAYEQTTLHRTFANSLLNENQQLRFFQIQYQLNHWPILPGYIDYVSSFPGSGIVNDMTVELESENLRAQHGAFDINEVSVGFHVLEYLLWGENLDGSALRPARDFAAQTSLTAQQVSDGLAVENLPNNRRRELVRLLAALLQEDFANLLNLWADGSNSYRLTNSTGAEQSLQRILAAMTSFLREEILVSSLYLMLNGEFEESRPSIFSETSQNVVSAQLTGLELLLLEIGRSQGNNLDQLLNRLSADYEEFFLQNLDASKECLVVLYSATSRENMSSSEVEFKVVECINSLTNMIDYLERIGTSAA